MLGQPRGGYGTIIIAWRAPPKILTWPTTDTILLIQRVFDAR